MEINLVLAQPNYRSGPVHLNNWYLPYTTGCLWAYAQQDDLLKKNLKLVDWIWDRPFIEETVDQWEHVDVLFCSVYLWNENYVKQLSECVKKKWPNCKVIWGGPNCDHSNNDVFQEHPYIDAFAVSEGEVTFHEVCTKLVNNESLNEVHGLVLNVQNKVQRNRARPRYDIEDFPSPYLSRVFDDIIEKNPTVNWSVILETTRGCPYRCTYCDWGGGTATKVKKFILDKVESEIKWFTEKQIKFIMIADANFGIFKERDLEIARFLNESREENPGLEGVSLSFLKNKTDSMIEIATELKDLMHNGVSVSVQSLDPHTLDVIKRGNMEINNVGELIKKLETHGIPYYTELIMGMPGETLESWKKNIWKLYEHGFHKSIAVYPLINSVNTELNQVQKKEYQFEIKPMRGISDDNHIEEFYPTVVGTKVMPYSDYLDAWVFTKIQNVLHCSGYSLDASAECYKKGIHYEQFYETLISLLEETPQWKEFVYVVRDLLDQVFSDREGSATEIEVDGLILKSFLGLRETIFELVFQTLERHKIANRDSIIQHAKALTYNPLCPNHWPQTVNGKKYTYTGMKVDNMEQFVEFYSHRRGNIFVSVENIS